MMCGPKEAAPMLANQALKKLIVLLVEQILVMLVGIADTAMVSYAGEAAISGVALVDMSAYMIITILTASEVIVSQNDNRLFSYAEKAMESDFFSPWMSICMI